MADISLDDFIKTKNVKVRLNNPQAGQRRKPQQRTSAGVGQNVPPQKLQIRKTFDARSKLGPKAVVDARDKIVVIKKGGGGDARNKIVQKQVQKGTFDARSLLQRQAQKAVRKKGPGGPGSGPPPPAFKPTPVTAPGPLTRTLSNPNAKSRGQVRATPGGLQVTRPVPSTEVSFTGSSLQVTKRNKPVPGMTPQIADAVPIIQIRNDRYRNPAAPPQPTLSRGGHPHPPAPQYPQPTAYREPGYGEYQEEAAYFEPPPFPQSRGYKDWDNPQYNPSSISVPEIPKVHMSSLKTVEAAGMRPVSYSGGFSQHPPRAPPGAASVSQPSRQLATKTVTPSIKISPAGLKRKPVAAPDVSGPLRLGRGGGPGIDLDPSPNKKSKAAVAEDLEIIDLESDGAVISPLQGYRVMVTNLFNGVTQDDIIELFGAVGPLKKAKLLKPGSAEVVYISKPDAVSAVQKYHSRELDGQPMYVKMTTPVAAVVKKAAGDVDPDITGEALRLYKKSGIGSLPEAPIEIPTIHRALFKAGPPGPNKSVKFTVKI
ncbi:polymerase delta-interacting protein 3 isoform X2 [Aplysia californica]|uniref:Polymerase delta-interacting protein 3 isoform X2 n=1 Tax=Aplysia californica TaxID=6500 RepID=A0ABM0K939_APLCA|nr:polymerase delta-interacting protein 3 isoform X2 [Aplysia californica]